MKTLLLRLRAVLTPNVLIVLLVILLVISGTRFSGQKTYTESLEHRASEVLSMVHGAGKVHVVIRMRKLSEKNGALGMQTLEVPCAAVAVAEGADDPIVCHLLEQALCVLLDLSASAVSIVTGG